MILYFGSISGQQEIDNVSLQANGGFSIEFANMFFTCNPFPVNSNTILSYPFPGFLRVFPPTGPWLWLWLLALPPKLVVWGLRQKVLQY